MRATSASDSAISMVCDLLCAFGQWVVPLVGGSGCYGVRLAQCVGTTRSVVSDMLWNYIAGIICYFVKFQSNIKPLAIT